MRRAFERGHDSRRDPDAAATSASSAGGTSPKRWSSRSRSSSARISRRATIPAFADRARSAARSITSAGRRRSTKRGASRRRAGGARIFLKREDLTHTGAHKINNALGQALLAARMGKRRIVAETGAGQHGVATATACALLGLECHVYMGAEDMDRQALNVFRMRLLGAEVCRVDAGSRTLKDAINEAMRDWVTNVVGHVLSARVGAGAASVSVDGPRVPVGDRPRGARSRSSSSTGRLPDAIVACVGGGSNAIGIFDAFIDDRDVRLIGVEAGGERDRPRPPRRAVCRRQRRRAAGDPHVRAAGRGWEHRADAFDFGRARLRGGRARARLAARRRPGRVRVRDGCRGARSVSDAGAARRDPAGARIGPCDRVRAARGERARTRRRSCW